MVLQLEYKPWMEEDPAGDRDPVASHAYAVAEAAAKAAGSSPTAEVQSLSGNQVLQQTVLQPCCNCAAQSSPVNASSFLMRSHCSCLGKPTFASCIMFCLLLKGSWRG